jgi:ABC-type multidrug transport system permease subunit
MTKGDGTMKKQRASDSRLWLQLGGAAVLGLLFLLFLSFLGYTATKTPVGPFWRWPALLVGIPAATALVLIGLAVLFATAAIAGNTSGAWNGRQGIPKRWLDNLERGYKGRNYIITLAQSLFDHQSHIEPMNAFVDYLADWWRNIGFIFNMLTRKPMR